MREVGVLRDATVREFVTKVNERIEDWEGPCYQGYWITGKYQQSVLQGFTLVLARRLITVCSSYNMPAANLECGPEVFLLLLVQQMLNLPLNWTKPTSVEFTTYFDNVRF